MGAYYNVSEVKTSGRRVYGQSARVTGKLVAICDNGMFECAVDVSKPEEYEEFEKQYLKGMLLSMDLYDYTP